MSEKMPETDRRHLVQNPYQGDFKRVLCVCSGGILRSPTAALILSQPPYSFNTRAAGILDYALIKVDRHLVGWAQEIVCMEHKHARAVEQLLGQSEHYPNQGQPIKVLEIPDNYNYRDPDLIKLIRRAYDAKGD
jgi:predicted protein tyrosine phosphatase